MLFGCRGSGETSGGLSGRCSGSFPGSVSCDALLEGQSMTMTYPADVPKANPGYCFGCHVRVAGYRW